MVKLMRRVCLMGGYGEGGGRILIWGVEKCNRGNNEFRKGGSIELEGDWDI
jgi:hypothetical protein